MSDFRTIFSVMFNIVGFSKGVSAVLGQKEISADSLEKTSYLSRGTMRERNSAYYTLSQILS